VAETDPLNRLVAPLLRLAVDAGLAILSVSRSGDLQTERKDDDSPLTRADRASHEIIVSGLRTLAPHIPVLSEEGEPVPWDERAGWDELWVVDPLDGTKSFIKQNGEYTVNIALVRRGEPVLGVIYAPDQEVVWWGIAGGAARKIDGAELSRLRSGSDPVEAAAIGEPIAVRPRDDRRITVIASRTHLNTATVAYIERVTAPFSSVEIVNVSSSLKLCLIAEGHADLYPRFAPTNEWDIAAGHAIIRAAGGDVYQADSDQTDAIYDAGRREPLRYNKRDLLNPSFVACAW
jgi:3'(2'), 5'-bisphosphate nucleotidase